MSGIDNGFNCVFNNKTCSTVHQKLEKNIRISVNLKHGEMFWQLTQDSLTCGRSKWGQ